MQEAFRHEALPYVGLDGFVASCTELIELGDGSNTRLMFVCAAAKLEALRDAVGDDSDDIGDPDDGEHHGGQYGGRKQEKKRWRATMAW